jgi:hypothetical protein
MVGNSQPSRKDLTMKATMTKTARATAIAVTRRSSPATGSKRAELTPVAKSEKVTGPTSMKLSSANRQSEDEADRVADILAREALAKSKLNHDCHKLIERLQTALDAADDFLRLHDGAEEADDVILQAGVQLPPKKPHEMYLTDGYDHMHEAVLAVSWNLYLALSVLDSHVLMDEYKGRGSRRKAS